jgi:hypothetical protein
LLVFVVRMVRSRVFQILFGRSGRRSLLRIITTLAPLCWGILLLKRIIMPTSLVLVPGKPQTLERCSVSAAIRRSFAIGLAENIIHSLI